MICDGERAVALAGIMGGLNSEIFANTENVLIESAFFDPVTKGNRPFIFAPFGQLRRGGRLEAE